MTKLTHAFIFIYEVCSLNSRLPAFDIRRYSISKGFREALDGRRLWKTKWQYSCITHWTEHDNGPGTMDCAVELNSELDCKGLITWL